MHILIVTDQHAESLGGVQVSIRLQRKFLERQGHTVSIAASALHRPEYAGSAAANDPAYIDLPSLPITRDREYSISFPGLRTDRALAAALRGRPPVDIVHVQGDFWGAMIGYRAARGLRVPVVHTLHNHVDAGTRAVAPLFAPLAFLGLRGWRALALGRSRSRVAGGLAGSPRPTGAWKYLAELVAEAAVVTAPSQHFARLLREHGVAERIEVTPTGVDDDVLAEVRASGARSERSRPKLIWLGRMSPEKRVLEFVDAVARSGVDADVELYGAGLLLPQVQRRIVQHGLGDRVTIPGPVPYAAALAAMRDADLLVQTSRGFETQGMTPFEAAALGTPTLFSDADIADDLDVSPAWRVRPAVTGDDEVAPLARALASAVKSLANTGESRVSEAEGARFMQSTRMSRMGEIYEKTLQ